jgi:hypothetical protein
VLCVELARTLLGAAEAGAGEACVVTVPRTGSSLTLMGATLPAGALDSRFVFLAASDSGVVLGDVVVPAMQRARFVRDAALAGATITSVHRHLAGEQPELAAVHLLWRGAFRTIATGLRQLLGPPVSPPSGPGAIGPAGIVAGVPCVQLAATVAVAGTAVIRGPGSCAMDLPGDSTRVTVGGVTAAVGLLLGSRVYLGQTSDRTAAVLSAALTVPALAAAALFEGLTAAGLDVVAWHTAVLGEAPPMARLHVQGRGNPLLMLESVAAALATAQNGGGSSGSGGPESVMR